MKLIRNIAFISASISILLLSIPVSSFALMGGAVQGLDLNLTMGNASVTTLAGSAGMSGSADGTGAAARFYGPTYITTDGMNLYVAEFDNHTIRKIVIATGVVTTLAGSAGMSGSADGTGAAARFNYPYGVTTDGTNLYVGDFINNAIRKIVISTGFVTTLAGSAGTYGSVDGTGAAARFNMPSGITTDGMNLYITDSANRTIRKIVIFSGTVTTLAGSAGMSGSADGTGAAARFNCPAGITTDGTNLYVADYLNHTIRTISNAAMALYFPHVAASLPWQTEIAAVNTSAQAVAGTLKAYNDAGQLVETKDINLTARGRKQLNVADEFTNHANIGYMILDTGSDTVEGYTKFYQEGLYRAAIPAAKEVNNSDIYVSHIASNDQWWTGISLVNTTADRRDITIKFNNGKSKYITLNGGQHYAFSIRDLFNGQPQPDIESAVISGAAGVMGLELFGGPSQLDGIPLTGKTCATLYYPHVASNDQWWTGIVAYNSSKDKGTITITPYDAQGNALAPSSLPIEGKEKYIGVVSNLGLPADTAWFKIDSTTPLSGFELFGTMDGQQLGPYAGSCETGATEGVFAKLEKQGWTGIAFVNKDDSDASVTLMAYNLISRRNYNDALPGSWMSKALRISRCALVTSVRI